MKVGYFGKLPARGDFLSKDVPRSVVGPWDEWLQRGLEVSKDLLGAEWLPVYLTSPLWNFAISSGTFAPATVAGVLMPSVDRVGRYFPFTLMAVMDSHVPAARLAVSGTGWFQAMGEQVLAALDESLDLEAFDSSLSKLSEMESGDSTGDARVIGAEDHLRLDAAGTPSLEVLGGPLLDALLKDRFGFYTIWWTEGSERVGPTWLACSGLPKGRRFAALIDGEWEERGWHGQERNAASLAG